MKLAWTNITLASLCTSPTTPIGFSNPSHPTLQTPSTPPTFYLLSLVTHTSLTRRPGYVSSDRHFRYVGSLAVSLKVDLY
jgi:hypothetical protein